MAMDIMDSLFEDDGRGGDAERPTTGIRPAIERTQQAVKEVTAKMIQDGFANLNRALSRQPKTSASRDLVVHVDQPAAATNPRMEQRLLALSQRIDTMVDVIREGERANRAQVPVTARDQIPMTRALQRIDRNSQFQLDRLDRIVELLRNNAGTAPGGGGAGGLLDDVLDNAGGNERGRGRTGGRGGRGRLARGGRAAGIGLLAGAGVYGLSRLFGADEDTAEVAGGIAGSGAGALNYRATGSATARAATGGAAAGEAGLAGAEGAASGAGRGLLSGAGRLAAKAAVPLQLGLAGFDAYQTENDESLTRTQKNVQHAGTAGGLAGGLAGAAAGGTAGAAAGALLAPVTLGASIPIGALIGSIVGGIGGSFGGKWMGEKGAEAIAEAVNHTNETAEHAAVIDKAGQDATAKQSNLTNRALAANTEATKQVADSQDKLAEPLATLADPSWADSLRNSLAGATASAAKFIGNLAQGAGDAVQSVGARVAQASKGTMLEGAGRMAQRAATAVGGAASSLGEATVLQGGQIAERLGKNFRSQNFDFTGVKNGASLQANGSYTSDEVARIKELSASGANTSANLQGGMSQRTRDKIIQQAVASGEDPKEMLKIAAMESGGNANAISSTGAIGTFQFTGKTATGVGISNRFDEDQNIAGGIKLAAMNRQALQKAGLPATAENLYMMHQLGPAAATEVINGAQKGLTKDQLSPATQDAMNKNYGSKSATAADYLATNAKALNDRYTSVVKGGDDAIAAATNPNAPKSKAIASATPASAAPSTSGPTTAATTAPAATATPTSNATVAKAAPAQATAPAQVAQAAPRGVEGTSVQAPARVAQATPVQQAVQAAPASAQMVTPGAELAAPGRTSFTQQEPVTVGNYEPPATAAGVAAAVRATTPAPQVAQQVDSGVPTNAPQPIGLDSVPIYLDDLGLVIFNTPQLS